MKLVVSDINEGEYDVEVGRTIDFKISNPNDAIATIQNVTNEDSRVRLSTPNTLKAGETKAGRVRIPPIVNPNQDDLEELNDLVTLKVQFLK